MRDYLVQYDYSRRTGGSNTFVADTKDEAEMLCKEWIGETFPDVFDIEIVEVDAV